MSARAVADLMALAYEGFAAALATKDAALKLNSLRVAAKAFAHPDAGAFFGGVALALSELPDETKGNDPSYDDNGDWDLAQPDGEDPDEDSPAASPAYEGLVDGEDDEHRLDDGSKRMKPGNPDVGQSMMRGALYAAAANWARVNKVALQVAAELPPHGTLLVQEFKTLAGAQKRCSFENAHSKGYRYTIEKTGENVWQLRKTRAPGKMPL